MEQKYGPQILRFGPMPQRHMSEAGFYFMDGSRNAEFFWNIPTCPTFSPDEHESFHRPNESAFDLQQ